MKKSITMRCLVMLAFLAVCSLGFAQMPTGFPTMPNTGNAQADAQAYDQAKQQWLEANPSQNVNAPVQVAPVTTPTEQENADYEAAKVLANTPPVVSIADQAAHQLRGLQGFMAQNSDNLKGANPRLLEAYITALNLAEGQTIVNIPAGEYATFHQELKDLVDANTALFHVVQ